MPSKSRIKYDYLIFGGAPKSATTSLFRHLSDHPEVCPANRKETYFFARAFDYNKVCISEETLQAFENYFSHCDQTGKLRMEATPYTLYSRGAVEKIKALLPNPAAFFILRDPIQRLFSDYRFHKQREHPSARNTLREFIDLQLEMRGNVPNLIELGCYSVYLRPFFDILGRDRVYISFFEEYLRNPVGEMQKICEFAGLDPDFYSNYIFELQNPTINARSQWLNRVYMGLEPAVANLRARILSNPTAYRLFRAFIDTGKLIYFKLNSRATAVMEEIPPYIYSELQEYYRPYNQALHEELGRPLPWKSFEYSS